MTTLRFDDESGRYTGEYLRIDEVQFLRVLQRRILDGEAPAAALARLLQEESWRRAGATPAGRSADNAAGRPRSSWRRRCRARRVRPAPARE